MAKTKVKEAKVGEAEAAYISSDEMKKKIQILNEKKNAKSKIAG